MVDGKADQFNCAGKWQVCFVWCAYKRLRERVLNMRMNYLTFECVVLRTRGKKGRGAKWESVSQECTRYYYKLRIPEYFGICREKKETGSNLKWVRPVIEGVRTQRHCRQLTLCISHLRGSLNLQSWAVCKSSRVLNIGAAQKAHASHLSFAVCDLNVGLF